MIKNDFYYTFQYSSLAVACIAYNVKSTRSKTNEFCCVIWILYSSFGLGANTYVGVHEIAHKYLETDLKTPQLI